MDLMSWIGVRGVVLVALAALSGAGGGIGDIWAQADSLGSGIPSPLVTQLGKVPRGKMIRVSTNGPLVHTGRLADFDAVALRLESEDSPVLTFPLEEIRSLRVRGRATLTGALIGGAAGLAFGVLAGVFVAQIADEGSGPDYAGTVPAVGLLFTVAGAGTGAILGSAFPKWRLKWP